MDSETKYPTPKIDFYYRHNMPFSVTTNSLIELSEMVSHVKTEFCEHDWEEYVGLTQRYQYCAKCDEKMHY